MAEIKANSKKNKCKGCPFKDKCPKKIGKKCVKKKTKGQKNEIDCI